MYGGVAPALAEVTKTTDEYRAKAHTFAHTQREAIQVDARRATGYILDMIGTIRHKALQQFFENGNAKGLPPDMLPRLRRMLSALHAADDLDQLRTLPGWRLHPLKGDLQDYWSLSVSGNWRLVFRWQKGKADDLDLLDYH